MQAPNFAVDFLSAETLDGYMTLEQPPAKIQAEYIWIGGTGLDLRCKTKTLDLTEVTSLSQLPVWNYDGSSTLQAPGKDSEVYLKPIAMYKDPFRRGKNILVLCEACLPDAKLTPIPTNTRRRCLEVMEQAKEHEPWFGIEQEFALMAKDRVTPFGWPKNGYPRPQGPFYCSAGTENAFGRRVVEAHYRACLYAGLTISGINGEVLPGQWEYQVGPCLGIDSGDMMVVSRFILQRVCEDFGICVSFDPKPVPGDWNGSGCHTNYSTNAMREEGGYAAIINAVEALGKRHKEHIAAYGSGNERRLTGAHETAPIDKFSYGVAHRGASVRIPRQAKLDGKGYFEDRRPASNMDPYVVTMMIVQTTLLDDQARAEQNGHSSSEYCEADECFLSKPCTVHI
jgi:glutamine synthetase